MAKQNRLLKKPDGNYGGKVGNRMVFTKEGAINVYKLFLDTCYNELSEANASVLSSVEQDLHNIGFSWEEIEQIETDYLSNSYQSED